MAVRRIGRFVRFGARSEQVAEIGRVERVLCQVVLGQQGEVAPALGFVFDVSTRVAGPTGREYHFIRCRLRRVHRAELLDVAARTLVFDPQLADRPVQETPPIMLSRFFAISTMDVVISRADAADSRRLVR
jgi:hypothetical protein